MEVLCEARNHIAFLTLNRPAALNALSLEMIVELRRVLEGLSTDPDVRAIFMRGAGEKAFCAGGDIRALYDSYQNSGTLHLEFFAEEYPLDFMLRCFPKPYIALLDGITMGGGMGIAQGSPMRIVGERTRMAMPEVSIGFFPDVGGSYFLSRLAGALGPYLALSGVQIRAADAVYVGLADVYLPPAAVDRLESDLRSLRWDGNDAAAWREQLLGFVRSRAAAAGEAPLAKERPAIDQHFSAASVPALFDSLEREARAEYTEWAQKSLALLQTRSPTMLAVTLEQLRRARSLSFADCLRMEIGMARRSFDHGDFVEGVRALIIDKDNKPTWRPSRLEDVTERSVAAMFEDPWAGASHPLSNLEQLCN